MTSQAALLTIGFMLVLGAATFMNYEGNVSTIDHGFTADFATFIKAFDTKYDFIRSDITWSTYGGAETRPTSPPSKYPIVFVHGNSDIGAGNGGTVGWQTGFTTLIEYLQNYGGYTKADLYVTTWGPANPNLASQNSHNEKNVMTTRRFIEGVLKYTQASKVIVIGHSMGVTLARAAIIGGTYSESMLAKFTVGDPITSSIAGFFGLAGANYGLVDCTYATGLPTCSTYNGFSPSSQMLSAFNSKTRREGAKIYSFWSPSDDIIKYNCIVNQKNTCIVPGSDESFQQTGYTHFDVRDKFGADILRLIQKL